MPRSRKDKDKDTLLNAPIVLVNSQQKFNAIQDNNPLTKKWKIPSIQEGKQKNISPGGIKIVEPKLRKRCQNVQLPLNYIKHHSSDSINQQEYELTYRDLDFIENCKKEKGELELLLTQQILSKAIVFLQKYEEKHQKEKPSITWIQLFTSKIFDHIEPQIIQKIDEKIFNYWRSRREQDKFPLYRPNWFLIKKGSYYNKFLVKLKKKRLNLNRLTKKQEKQVLTELSHQLQQANNICTKVRTRQILKLEKTTHVIKSFFEEVSSYIDVSIQDYFPFDDFQTQFINKKCLQKEENHEDDQRTVTIDQQSRKEKEYNMKMVPQIKNNEYCSQLIKKMEEKDETHQKMKNEREQNELLYQCKK